MRKARIIGSTKKQGKKETEHWWHCSPVGFFFYFFEWQFVSAETIRISFEAKGNHGKHDDDAVDTL